MTYDFHPEARREYREAAAFYESRRPGLGAAFSVEVEAAISRILEAPERWRRIEQDVPRAAHVRFLTRFFTASIGARCLLWQSCTYGANLVTGERDCPPGAANLPLHWTGSGRFSSLTIGTPLAAAPGQ